MSETPRVLFVCLHGSAKSLVAARYLERLAAERGVRLAGSCAGLEPYEEVPPAVVAGLAGDGFDVAGTRPVELTAAMADGASRIVAFGCDVGAVGPGRTIVQWEDVPAVSDDYDVARDAIVARVRELLDSITAESTK